MKYSQLEQLADIIHEEFLHTGVIPDMLVTLTKDSREELDQEIFLKFGVLKTIPTNCVFQNDTKITSVVIRGIVIRLKQLET